MNPTNKVSFLKACTEFFGLKADQRPLDFGKEVMALTNDDRAEIAAGLTANGYDIDQSTILRKA